MDSGKPFLGTMSQIPVEFQTLQSTTPTDEIATRRSSRPIKRKRFDDEFVECLSVQNLPAQQVIPSSSANDVASNSLHLHPSRNVKGKDFTAHDGSATNFHTRESNSGRASTEHNHVRPSVSKPLTRRPLVSVSKSFRKCPKRQNRREGYAKDLGRWKPTDDLALITAIIQTNSLAVVHRGVKFSCHFSLGEIRERWHALLFVPVVSRLAFQAIKSLHPDIILAVERKTLYSAEETKHLSRIKSIENPGLNDMSDLLEKHAADFHRARTPCCLLKQWRSLKQYSLLDDQNVQPLPNSTTAGRGTEAQVLNFSDAERNILDADLVEPMDEELNTELAISDRSIKIEIRHLEDEISRWQVLVNKVMNTKVADFDEQTLAVLRGRQVRYLMRNKEISLGRVTKDNMVDVDFKLEGPSGKISRRQGAIKLDINCEFFIANEGKRCIFVDGRPIQCGCLAQLLDNSTVEISCLKFVFLINVGLIEKIRSESANVVQMQMKKVNKKKKRS